MGLLAGRRVGRSRRNGEIHNRRTTEVAPPFTQVGANLQPAAMHVAQGSERQGRFVESELACLGDPLCIVLTVCGWSGGRLSVSQRGGAIGHSLRRH